MKAVDENMMQRTSHDFLTLSDPGVLADVEKWKKGLAQYSARYVGQTLVYLNGTSEECRFRECNLGNLICDATVIITVQLLMLLLECSATETKQKHFL